MCVLVPVSSRLMWLFPKDKPGTVDCHSLTICFHLGQHYAYTLLYSDTRAQYKVDDAPLLFWYEI